MGTFLLLSSLEIKKLSSQIKICTSKIITENYLVMLSYYEGYTCLFFYFGDLYIGIIYFLFIF